MDHGMLNLPIGHRGRGGSIDAQIDQWKAGEARKQREASRTAHELRQEARRLVSAATDEQVAPFAARLGLTMKQARASLRSQCIANPSLIVRHFAA